MTHATTLERAAYLEGANDAQAVERALAKIEAEDQTRFIEWVAAVASGQHADPWETLRHIADQARQTLAALNDSEG